MDFCQFSNFYTGSISTPNLELLFNLFSNIILMGEESKSIASKKYNVTNNSNYKHHKVGKFTCESEVLSEDNKLICCLHDPKTGEWKWEEKGGKN